MLISSITIIFLDNYAEEGGAMIVGRSNSFTSVDCVFSCKLILDSNITELSTGYDIHLLLENDCRQFC